MNNSKIKIAKEKDAIKGTDKNDQIQDFRLNESYFKTLIGKCFKKYRCDPFEYTNSVTGIVGIYIDDKTFELRNEQKSIAYFDSVDDIALWTFREVHTEDIRSFFEDTDQIDTPVNEIVKKITLVNELQKAKISNEIYEMLITSEYSGVAEPGIPPNRTTLIPVAKARVSTTESHMKRGTFEHMCG